MVVSDRINGALDLYLFFFLNIYLKNFRNNVTTSPDGYTYEGAKV